MVMRRERAPSGLDHHARWSATPCADGGLRRRQRTDLSAERVQTRELIARRSDGALSLRDHLAHSVRDDQLLEAIDEAFSSGEAGVP